MAEVKNIVKTQSIQIERMLRGDSLLRIGPIWYGEDELTTVPSLTYVSNKQVKTIPVLRADVAMSFSTSSPPIDKVSVELVINYDRFRTHVQKLFALIQLNPVVPILNPVLASLMQPIDSNRAVYRAYGHTEVDEFTFSSAEAASSTKVKDMQQKMMYLYCSVPIQVRVDSIRLENIKGASRDIRLIVLITRVLTANSYGDRVKYVRTLSDAREQYRYVNKITSPLPDSNQTKTILKLLGIDYDRIDTMLTKLGTLGNVFEEDQWTEGTVEEVMSGDIIKVKRIGSNSVTSIKLAGIQAPQCNLKAYGQTKEEFQGFAAKKSLANILSIGTPIRIKKLVIDTEGSIDLPNCMVRTVTSGTESPIDPALEMLRIGMVRYTGTYLPDNVISAYSSAGEQAKAAKLGIYKLKVNRK